MVYRGGYSAPHCKGSTFTAREFTFDDPTELVSFGGDVNRHVLIVKASPLRYNHYDTEVPSTLDGPQMISYRVSNLKCRDAANRAPQLQAGLGTGTVENYCPSDFK